MAKFKHKNGGICEVFSLDNIEKFSKDSNYTRIDAVKANNKPKHSQEDKPTINIETVSESGK